MIGSLEELLAGDTLHGKANTWARQVDHPPVAMTGELWRLMEMKLTSEVGGCGGRAGHM